MSTTANLDENKNSTAPLQPEADESFVSPAVNIAETPEGYVLQADLPGVNKSGLDISVDANTLTITGRRERVASPGTALHVESSEANYRRVFELDPAIDSGKIDAKLEQGVLTIQLPKSERAKPRKVVVNN